MKKHIKVIKLIIATAALVALGVIAFKFMYKNKDKATKIQKNIVL